jgi:hypothetical protein
MILAPVRGLDEPLDSACRSEYPDHDMKKISLVQTLAALVLVVVLPESTLVVAP